jgi:hypothetical protein
MVGYGEDKGIIPIASEKIFDRINANTDGNLSFKVESSMLEIYMEKIRDLFNPGEGDLKIRLDPKKGFFVQGLTKNTVGDYATIETLMEAGTKARTVAATNMNATSSRAHTIFQLTLTQTKVDAAAGKATDKTSMINLIDLAGSERADSTGATGARLKEGSAINLSLTALGNVISALAYNSDPSNKKEKKVPYRDSALTMLLQNSLGGNAKTIMIAAISPADVNHDETLSTLRYADRAKQIKNKAVVNEDPNEKLIRNLRKEVEQLRAMLAGQGIVPGDAAAGGGDIEELKRQMEAEQAAEIERMRKEIEEKMKAQLLSSHESELAMSKDSAAAKAAELRAMGVLTGEELVRSREKAATEPHLINLHEDPQFSRQIYYFLKQDGEVTIGRRDAAAKQDILLGGLSVQAEHASIVGDGKGSFELTVCSAGAKTSVNGDSLEMGSKVKLHHNNRVIFGNNHVFLLNIPGEVADGTAPTEPDVPAEVTFDFAIQEVNKAQVAAIAAEEERRRKEAEEERAKAEEKVRLLEEQMQAERKRMQEESDKRLKELAAEAEAGDAEAKARQEAMLGEARKQQQVLEKKLQEQIAEVERLAAKKQKEMRERSLLDEKLLKTIPLVNEANAIADELKKNVLLELRLMANLRKNLWTGDPDDDGDVAPEPMDTEVYVRAAPREGTGIEALWHYDDFMERLYAMREMYQAFVGNDRSLPVPGYEDVSTDPFYVVPEDMLLGKATVVLDTLLHIMPITETTPILDHKGVEQGELVVRVTPHFGEKIPENDEEADEDLLSLGDWAEAEIPDSLSKLLGRKLHISVKVESARGLPLERSVGAHVRFSFFLEDKQRMTPAIEGKSMNPRFDYTCTFTNVITDELLSYLDERELIFELWARQDDGSAKMATGPAKRFNRGSMIDDVEEGGAAEQVREEARRAAEAAEARVQEEVARREALEAKVKALEAMSSGTGGDAALAEMRRAQEAEYQAKLNQMEAKLKEANAAKAKLEADLASAKSGSAAHAASAAGSDGAELAELRKALEEEKKARAKAEKERVAAEAQAKTAAEAAAASSKQSKACVVM